MIVKSTGLTLEEHYAQIVRPMLDRREMNWMLVCSPSEKRIDPIEERGTDKEHYEPGVSIHVNTWHRILPIVKGIIAQVANEQGIPLELDRLLTKNVLPLDDEAGYRIALIFLLAKGIRDLDRVELIARRISRFTREEAAYWHSRCTDYGDVQNRWGKKGLAIMLCGESGDEDMCGILEKERRM